MESDKVTNVVNANSKEWLIERFDLFETYCLPSVVNQKNKNFFWLVFFDISTDPTYVEKINNLEKEHSFFNAIYLDGAKVFNKSVVEEVKIRLREYHTHVITSRLDNDDAIHKLFISRIQKKFNKQNFCYVECPYGYCLLGSHKMKLASIKKLWNPFASLIEVNSNRITTISTRNHIHWEGVQDMIEIRGNQWVQVIHGNNILNRFDRFGYMETGGFLTSDYNILQKDFNIPQLPYQGIGSVEIQIYNAKLCISGFLKKLRTSLVKCVKRFVLQEK